MIAADPNLRRRVEMKLYIPIRIAEQIESTLAGQHQGKVYGTLCSSEGVVTVSAFEISDSNTSDPTRHLLSDLSTNTGPLSFKNIDGKLRAFETDSGEELTMVPIAEESFFKRTPYDGDVMDHLRSKRILIVGLGSMGSVIGKELATSGVGCLIGMDKDVLEIHNCMRHLLGPAFVGWPKPNALKAYFNENVPACEFIPVYGNLFLKENRHQLKTMMEQYRPTHILAVTDVLKVQYLCQRLAFEYGLPLMAVWCDNNAVEGEIFMWEPGQATGWKHGRPERGCYACLRPMDKPTITRSQFFDYSSDDPDSYGGEPALGSFINRVNNIASIFLLAWLLRDCKKETKLASILNREYFLLGLQYIRLGGAYPMTNSSTITASNPWAVEWFRVKRNPDCPICSSKEANESVLFPQINESEDEWDA